MTLENLTTNFDETLNKYCAKCSKLDLVIYRKDPYRALNTIKKKSGVSKWDSYSEDEKEKAREYFQEYYVQNPVGDLTCEQAWAQFVEYLKTTDSNA